MKYLDNETESRAVQLDRTDVVERREVNHVDDNTGGRREAWTRRRSSSASAYRARPVPVDSSELRQFPEQWDEFHRLQATCRSCRGWWDDVAQTCNSSVQRAMMASVPW